MEMDPAIADKIDFPPSSDSEKGSNSVRNSHQMDINESGHAQEVERNFSLLSICSVGIVTGNTWAALGGSIAVAIYNGGPPGVIYEFICVSIFYWLIAASLAELASSMPSSAGVYHWASITPGPRYGRVCGWFAGWWNFLAWNFASASMSAIIGNVAVAMWSVSHPDFVAQKWHVFVAYLIGTWTCCCTILFFNRGLPALNNLGLIFILGGVFVTIIACAIMPSTAGSGHATSTFVWKEWENQTSYSSQGFVFLAGMLNGAFAVGTPDCVSHLAEEIPNPRRNVPLAMAAQMVIGFMTAMCYMIAIFYAITNLDAVLDSSITTLPLAEIYAQATSSKAGTIGLLTIIFLPVMCTTAGTYITAGRTLWTLARDDATPFAGVLGAISPRFKNPFNATLACACFSTVLGCIYVGSSTAFNAFVGSFVVLSTLSYLAAILPFLLTRRFAASQAPGGNAMVPGPFQMSQRVGYAVNGVSCLYIVVFIVIYLFPFSMPVNAGNMNYSCLITGGVSLFVAAWWFVKRGAYVGPQALVHPHESRAMEEAGMIA